MKETIRILCFLLAIVCLLLPPLQVRADVAYYPDEQGIGNSRDSREDEQENKLFLILTVVLWVIALAAVTFALLLWLKRR